MAVILEAFPKMSRELLVKTGYNATIFNFLYKFHGENYELEATTADTSTSRAAVYQLRDPRCQWHPEQNNLVIECKCIINTPTFLFGKNGLAAVDGGVLGVAIMWMTPDASVRGVVPIGELRKNTPAPAEIKGSLNFKEQQLRGTLILQTILFLKEKGNPEGIEKYQASQTGTILGVLDETRVIIDGNGSMFPIQEKASPTDPLWWVTCDWEDPTEDKFTYDNFCVFLNTAHKDYTNLNANEGLKNSPLLMEIICAALQILVTKVLMDPAAKDATINGKGLQPGSVSSVIHYLLRIYDWHFDPQNPERLSIDIRKSMMKML
jgi:hypothetical protein